MKIKIKKLLSIRRNDFEKNFDLFKIFSDLRFYSFQYIYVNILRFISF